MVCGIVGVYEPEDIVWAASEVVDGVDVAPYPSFLGPESKADQLFVRVVTFDLGGNGAVD